MFPNLPTDTSVQPPPISSLFLYFILSTFVITLGGVMLRQPSVTWDYQLGLGGLFSPEETSKLLLYTVFIKSLIYSHLSIDKLSKIFYLTLVIFSLILYKKYRLDNWFCTRQSFENWIKKKIINVQGVYFIFRGFKYTTSYVTGLRLTLC